MPQTLEESSTVVATNEANSIQTIEIDLNKFILASKETYTESQQEDIKNIITNTIGEIIEKRRGTLVHKDAATLFNGLLNGIIGQIQNFSDKSIGRRVFAKNIGHADSPMWQTFARNKNGTIEEWNITVQNLQKGLWIEIPAPVTFGIAYDALMRGDCDYIRNEDWSDMTMYLRNSNKKQDSLPPGYLVTVNDNVKLSVSASSMNSNNWIMIKLPKK